MILDIRPPITKETIGELEGLDEYPIIEYDDVVRYCSNCDEEYNLPEDMDDCLICGESLQGESEDE